jgi:class II flagellar assembly regulator FliX
MRILGSNANTAVTNTSASRRTAAGGTFTLSEGEAPRTASAPTALRTVGGIDALIALQGLEDATERRKRGVKRGRLALDALDELKIGLLGGTLSAATLNRLKAAASGLRDGSGDTGLDGVLGEIELRVEVEIAKMTARWLVSAPGRSRNWTCRGCSAGARRGHPAQSFRTAPKPVL